MNPGLQEEISWSIQTGAISDGETGSESTTWLKRQEGRHNWFVALAADTFSLQATSCPHACKHAHLCPFPSQRNQACARTGSFHGSPVPWRSRVRGTGEKRAVKDNLLLSFSFTHKAHQQETNLDLVTAGICVLFYSTCFSELYSQFVRNQGWKFS